VDKEIFGTTATIMPVIGIMSLYKAAISVRSTTKYHETSRGRMEA
jgi:hypothetical protein